MLSFRLGARRVAGRDFKSDFVLKRPLRAASGKRIWEAFIQQGNIQMNKSSVSILAAFVAVVGLSGPVLAAESLTSGSSSDPTTANFNEDVVLASLKARGISATDLEEWNGKIRATVTAADGSSSFQYFDLDTLRPLAAYGNGGGNTRVLSRMDVGAERPAPSLDSLTWVKPE